MMEKIQGFSYHINCIVDPKLQELFYRRAQAKYILDMELEYITPLLSVGPDKTDSLALRIDNYIMELESHMETFKLAHREYVERILENASGDKEEMYLIIRDVTTT